jgi:3-methyladenine DNA glycosylase AlkD
MLPYLIPLFEEFEKNSNPEYAVAQKKYMKGKFDFFGIRSPARREIARSFLKNHGQPDEDHLEEIVKDCWEQPQRDFHYFAMDLLAKKVKKAEICRVDLYEYLILTKSWWDTVDYLAARMVGGHFQKFPMIIEDYTEKWMGSGNMWLQRTAILFQLGYKQNTDLQLLTKYIEQLLGSKEFFINKAIGWILREFSKTDAVWVVNYVKENENRLANLSKREALKWLMNKGIIKD